ncbi:hypothetical protein HY990_02900 [Candidatus Micrarchaeota archaeon]|nr:hypothetical protein [Candidatus Micrarchaeota archaeon]
MKVNLKKLGAIVAGATILASSAAFAGLMFGSTQLVDNNGAPVAKVVVGSKANPSDGVAAALIAGKLVSETYKSQTLTAQYSGSASCRPGGNATGTGGTCSISNETVKLEINVPGSVALGTWQGTNLIGDFLNRELNDRKPNNDTTDTDMSYPYSTDTSDTANPSTNGGSSTFSGAPGQQYLYRVAGFTPFASQTLTDSASGNTYVEKQDLWIKGDNHFSSSKASMIGKVDFLIYSLKFNGPGGKEVGVPECTNANSTDYAYCSTTSATNSQYATVTHKLRVWFLGEQWIISDMTPPSSGSATTENTVLGGGEIKLAKESVAQILNQGESLVSEGVKFQLDDLEAHGDTTSAIVSIYNANGELVVKDKVTEGGTLEKTINGKKFRFHVYKVAPGYTFGAKWADVAIFSDELKLTSGQKLDQDNNTNDGWEVALGWKNLEASATVTNPDALRTIVLFSSDTAKISSAGGSTEDLLPGQYVKLVQSPEKWRLAFKGLDLVSSDMSSLTFDLVTDDFQQFSSSSGPLNTSNSVQVAATIVPPFVHVTSGSTGSVFEASSRSDVSGSLSGKEFYIAMNFGNHSKLRELSVGGAQTPYYRGAVVDFNGDGTVGNSGDQFLMAGTVFMPVSSNSDDFGYQNVTVEGAAPGYNSVRYTKVADGSNGFDSPNGGTIWVEFGNYSNTTHSSGIVSMMRSASLGCASGTDDSCFDTNMDTAASADAWFGISEKAGSGRSNAYIDYFVFGVDKINATNAGDANFQFTDSDSASVGINDNDNQILYGRATGNVGPNYYNGTLTSGPVDTAELALVKEGFTSERGSVFETLDTDRVSFSMAHKLGHAVWSLAPASNTTSSSTSTVVTLAEGQTSPSINGVTVKVLQIDEVVGACSAAGAASSCVADMSGVSAVIMPNNAPSVTVAMPYAYGNYGNLVVLDSDAVGVNTLVSVGGDKVNSMTASLVQGANVDWSQKVVREFGVGKIVVAGAEKEDTMAAAQDFISQLQRTN